jgi:hypothetical protein
MGNSHGRPIQAVTIMKMPSVNTVVSTMTPMISSPNSPCRRGTEPMLHGNKSRAIATNANIGTNASLNGRTANRLLAMSSETVPVLLRYCQDLSAKRSRLSHFRHRCAITFATITPDHAAQPVFCQHAVKSANSLAINAPLLGPFAANDAVVFGCHGQLIHCATQSPGLKFARCVRVISLGCGRVSEQ